MADPRKKQVTTLLQAVQAGDRGAAERLLALVYDHLYAMAKAHMARLPPGQTRLRACRRVLLANQDFV